MCKQNKMVFDFFNIVISLYKLYTYSYSSRKWTDTRVFNKLNQTHFNARKKKTLTRHTINTPKIIYATPQPIHISIFTQSTCYYICIKMRYLWLYTLKSEGKTLYTKQKLDQFMAKKKDVSLECC